jgi:hypothetical protein
MSVFGGTSLSTKGGRRSTLKQQIFRLMADGRERTTIDICNALGRLEASHQTSTGEALRTMATQGLLTRDDSLGIAIWKKVSLNERSIATQAITYLPANQLHHGQSPVL